MASVARYGKGYCVRYRVTDTQGVTTQKRVSGFLTKEDAWAQARDLERKSNAGIDVHGDTLACGQLMERWFAEHCIPNVATTTLARYSSNIDRLKQLPIYSLQIKRLTPQTQTDLITDICNGEGTGRDVSMVTAQTIIDPLRLSLSWAAMHGIIPINPLAYAKLPKVPKRQQAILNEHDVDDLRAFTVEHPFRIPLLLALYGGLRREEAAALRWPNVDFKRRTITISEALTCTVSGRLVQKDPKNDSSRRTISMPRFIMDELQNAPKQSEYVCISSDGKPYRPESFPKATRRIIQAINEKRIGTSTPPMPEASYHDLRHTHAAMLIKIGVQPKIIQERLGHSSIKITMDIYGYLMAGLQESVADALDKRVFQIGTNIDTRNQTPKQT